MFSATANEVCGIVQPHGFSMIVGQTSTTTQGSSKRKKTSGYAVACAGQE
jgi:hypothetical protein